jgi:hypothetical protein
VIALAVLGALVVAGVALLFLALVLVSGDIDDAATVAGRGDGVEMTLEEYDAIKTGMPLETVEDIAGGAGALSSSVGTGELRTEIYSWDGAGALGANALVTFQGGRVTTKAQAGLR